MKLLHLLAVCFLIPVLGAIHPLDPLTPEEIELARDMVRSRETNATFVTVALKEPPKALTVAWSANSPAQRVAEVVMLQGSLLLAEVDLNEKKIVRWERHSDKQPRQTDTEYKAITELVRADPEWRAAIHKRGITEFDKVFLNIWAYGNERGHGSPRTRLMRVLSHWRGDGLNAYGPAIEGLEVLVQCEPLKVLEVIDDGVRPISKASTDFFQPSPRPSSHLGLKPLRIDQPEGASFRIQENVVRWDSWQFRFSMHPRDGLVLHQVSFNDAGKQRSVLYRASVSEMMVPYGDPDGRWRWRSAIDEGEYGLGKLSCPLEHGKTAPPHAQLLPVVFADESGAPTELPARIAIYERQGENLWSHWDYENGVTGHRARELVIGFIATIGNYDYGLSWVFKRDGSLEFVAELTGILLTKGVDHEVCANCQEPLKPGKVKLRGDERYGTLVAPQVIGVNHQHYINLRLDFDIDGPENAVKEMSAKRERWWKNPGQNAFVAEQRVFGREKEARRKNSSAAHRHWAVVNPNQRTALGHNAGFLIEPGATTLPFMKTSALPRQIAGFVDYQFFATRYSPEELYAAGDFPSQALKRENVLTFGENNESIFNEDVVTWVTLGLTHIPRPEEFPVMPAAKATLKLTPKGFFDRNPALFDPESKD
ncbi:MAG TPA: tyramine oxidase [Methylomirabilota bacterium]|nr:tyramine oxidase [Methylomirabilota bacterium]